MPQEHLAPTGSELRDRVQSHGWHHQIDLGDGIVTPGHDKSADKLTALQLPALQGKSVLDVGAWDGYFSFAAERLGATRVVALDSYAWGGAPWGSQEPFRLARSALGSNVEDVHCEVTDVSPETVGGTFDIVLFLGVLYHMRHPMLALERVAGVTGETLVVETLSDLSLTRRPAAAYYPADSMDNDATNWWGPNEAALTGMLSDLGFSRIETINRRSPARRLGQVAYNAANIVHSRLSRNRKPLQRNYLTTDRLIIHAHR